ncbi:MBL fold metallo-hydrolase [Aliiruegeria sabulilitoris]|uniref:MBL fold metallo-hydrolase n=1 Tax=Aliiruegeria sabulilitoris TaxID=1510458 RepID=UPI00082A5632|nr:MBL fold metallo-hydrolase [Aliiruegeria sabulilitoris]
MKRRDLLKAAPVALLASGAAGLVPLKVRAAPGGAQVTAAQRFRVGEMTVTALSDGFIQFSPDAMIGIEAEDFLSLVEAAHQDPANVRGAVNAYMVESGGETWMIDAGTGPIFGPTLGHMPEVFAALGTDLGSVSKLIVTHLHGDHIGGATMDGKPVFPNAEMIVSEADRAFWTNDQIKAQFPEQFRGMFDLAKATLAAYGDKLRVIEGEADVAPGVTARPMPGHTVGHTGYMLESGSDSLLVWGDIIHVPAVQLARPEVTIMFDTDKEQAAATRADLMTALAGSGQRIAGMHMLFPGVGYLDTLGDGYHFVPAPWDYL